jgi:uncharacterized protein
MQNSHPPRWLQLPGTWGGNLQTLWGAVLATKIFGPPIAYRRERWSTPDHDFIDLDWLPTEPPPPPGVRAEPAPLLVMFHGLEGSSRSHYALAFASWARHNGWRFVVPHFRGCSGELNLAPRAYHSGDFEEIGWILQRLRSQHPGPLIAVGISMGGNALLRWGQEAGGSAGRTASAICAISSPLDLSASGNAIGRGFNRRTYTPMFLRTMIPRALKKAAQHPGLLNAQALAQARDLYTFDQLFTAPLHGYRSTEDYWQRASSKPHLQRLQLPSLVVNAHNDPFVPASSLPQAHEVSTSVTLWQPAHGGHVGFVHGPWPGDVLNLPNCVMDWLCSQARLPCRRMDTAAYP